MKKKIYIIISSVSIIVFSIIFYKTFYASHRDITTEKTQVSIAALKLQLNYAKDDTLANKEYADKVIEINGTITAIEQSTIVLDNMVQVDFLDKKTPNLKLGESLIVKGRCVGYDDLLEVVKIDQAIKITNK